VDTSGSSLRPNTWCGQPGAKSIITHADPPDTDTDVLAAFAPGDHDDSGRG